MKNKFPSEVHAIQTSHRNQFIDITETLALTIRNKGMTNGILTVFVPHTTAAVTINEAADPTVKEDILFALDQAFPDRKEFNHLEGNSAAHVKASVIGPSCQIIIEEGAMKLGTWQGVYFCEFDGPRTRRVYLKFIAD